MENAELLRGQQLGIHKYLYAKDLKLSKKLENLEHFGLDIMRKYNQVYDDDFGEKELNIKDESTDYRNDNILDPPSKEMKHFVRNGYGEIFDPTADNSKYHI